MTRLSTPSWFLLPACLALSVALAPPAARADAHGARPASAALEPTAPTAPTPPAADTGTAAGMSGISGMEMAGGEEMAMAGFLGPYSMTREASGTSWQPEASPHRGYHFSVGPWSMMAHGMLTIALDHQSGPRGGERTFSPNMAMVMGSRPSGGGRLGFRVMVSAETWTIGSRGYPLLLQTGETADGVHPLVDRQHPHDLFMEIAGTWSHSAGRAGSGYVYVGLPGEPALGPPAYMHRLSGMENPETPISHHWLDSTHISYGVATLGWVRGDLKVEGSLFNGREPDQNRKDIEVHRLDSYAFRASWQPAPDWSLQASSGRLVSPEQLEPDVDVTRTTASAIYDQRLANGGNFQTTFAWGRNAKSSGHRLDALLVEAALSPTDRQTAFARAERVEEDELFAREPANPLNGRIFPVAKLALGYVYDVIPGGPRSLRLGLGAMGDVIFVPAALEPAYGHRPVSYLLFVRIRN